MLRALTRLSAWFAVESNGNYMLCFAHVWAYYFIFNLLEAGIEFIIFGERFEHALDYVFAIAFGILLFMCLWACSIYKQLMEK